MAQPSTNPAISGRLLGQPAYRDWWLARLLAQTAQAALLYGLLILITARSDRSLYTSLFVVCSIIPSLAFGLIGGWLGDRLPQRGLLIVLNLIRAGLVVMLL